MKYTVTRDVLPEDTSNSCSVALWPEDAHIYQDETGTWCGVEAEAVCCIEDMSLEDFCDKYHLYIDPGEKKNIEIIVHWLEE